MQKVKLITENNDVIEGTIISITNENYLIEWPGQTPIWMLKSTAKLPNNGYPVRILEILNEQKSLLCD